MKQHDEWILGSNSVSGRHYLIHTIPPRFVAEVLGEHEETLPVSELSIVLDHASCLSCFHWIDPRPEMHLDKLQSGAANAYRQLTRLFSTPVEGVLEEQE